MLPDASVVAARLAAGRAVGTRPGRALRRQRGDVRHRHRDHRPARAAARERAHDAGRLPHRARAPARRSPPSSRPGIVPAALEMMDRACVAAVEASIYAAGYPTDAAAVLLVELDGQSRRGGRRGGDRRATSSAPAAPARCAARPTPADRARLWQGRKKAFGAMGRIAPDLAVQDAVVPRSALPDIMDRIAEIRDRHGSPSATSFTPATAICIPTSASTGTIRRWPRGSTPRAARSWRRASRPAAASPASTASAATRSTTCR